MFKVCPLNTMQETWQVILFSKQPLKNLNMVFASKEEDSDLSG